MSYTLYVETEETKKISLKSFEELDCWKACREVRRFIHKLVKKFPRKELYGLYKI